MSKSNFYFIRFIILCAALLAGCYQCSPAIEHSGKLSDNSLLSLRSHSNTGCPNVGKMNAILTKASSLMMGSDFNSATSLLRPIVGKKCNPRASILLAAAFQEQGNGARAIFTLRQAHSRWPSNDSIAASLAREYLYVGRDSQAVEALKHFHPNSYTHLQELKLAVVVYLAADMLPRALSIAQLAYKNYPSLETLILLSNVLQVEGRYPDVNRILGAKRKKYENDPSYLITIGESEADAGIYSEALEDIGHAVQLDPNSYAGHYLLGNIFEQTGQTKKALKEYRISIMISPDQPRTYYQMGRILERMGEVNKAELYFKQSLLVDRSYAPGYEEIGKIDIRDNDLKGAIRSLNLAIKYNPSSAGSRYLLVQAYARMGNSFMSRMALSDWMRYKKLHPLKMASMHERLLLTESYCSH